MAHTIYSALFASVVIHFESASERVVESCRQENAKVKTFSCIVNSFQRRKWHL